MSIPVIYESEYRFCLILWENQPILCKDMAKLCEEKLGWAKTTTYTVIKRLEQRGFLKKDGSAISSLYTKEDIQSARVDELVETTFEGSLPSFIAAFTKKRKLSKKEIASLKKLIEDSEDT